MIEESNIVRLPGIVEPEGKCPNKDVLTFIDELKEMALAGEITSLAVAYITGGGRAGHGWSASSERLKLLASVTILQHFLIIEDSE